MNFEQFLKDYKTQDAILRNIEVIGEVVKNLSDYYLKKRSRSELEQNCRDERQNYPFLFWCKLGYCMEFSSCTNSRA